MGTDWGKSSFTEDPEMLEDNMLNIIQQCALVTA